NGYSVDTIALALKAGKQDEAIRLAHTLKGIAGSIGAQALATATQNLEILLGNEEPCEKQLKSVQSELDKVLSDIRQLSAEGELELQKTKTETALLDNSEIKNRLRLLQKKVSLSDAESEEILEEIQQGVNEQLFQKLEPVRAALGRYDFEQSGEMLDRLMQEVVVSHD
ncbi:MAG: Hpt domain-containing protein, partial [Gammaproteobacteria bacterium]